MFSVLPHKLGILAAGALLMQPFLCTGRGTDGTASSELAGRTDSLQLMEMADEYLEAIGRLPIGQACDEVDFMLGSVQSDSVRNVVATRAYRYFRSSKVMGSENVSVHIYDKWFATFKAAFADIDELDEAEFYAFINRKSLIGAHSPELEVTGLDGESVNLPSKGRTSIIYFYSADCPKCLYTSIKLKEFLNSHSFDLDLFTIYTGDSPQQAQQYTSRELNVNCTGLTRVYHAEGGEAPYPVKYGVIQTPRLFLVQKDGIIVGRNLDVDALETLLDRIVNNSVDKFL